jgi:hypothetical protein
MNRDDFIFAGCRLIGVYCGVQGIINVALYGCYVIEEYYRVVNDPYPFNGPVFPVDLYRITIPVMYLVSAYLLTHRTQWCMRMVTPQRESASAAPSEGE